MYCYSAVGKTAMSRLHKDGNPHNYYNQGTFFGIMNTSNCDRVVWVRDYV